MAQHSEGAVEQTLLLNATYEPLKVVDWRKAMTLLCQGKVEVVSEYDREIRSVSVTFRLPSVIRLLRYITITRRMDDVPFSRANIYAQGWASVPILRMREFPVGGADLRSRRAGLAGRAQGLGEHRDGLHSVQPQKGWAHPGPGRDARHSAALSSHAVAGRTHHIRSARGAGELARLSVLEPRARPYVMHRDVPSVSAGLHRRY